MNQLTSPENLHLAGYLELLMDERREHPPRATDAGTERRMPRPVEERHAHPCELYAWRYLCL